ncbi:hypothetical protein M902_2528 [Bacteriovorax sp. BAL6_X]|uniref:hypothetical protein n=1 Tax=Bacteriovorax sp. BAL6_X TaxID=1201290 RepID=UPI0003865DA3|nr:hypothetical protein [Bacteriovorax sp. BAL6_X]EPZ51457.1 hypothetical protein M902_2528 [Bacteriovorax sp. BAL6_X]
MKFIFPFFISLGLFANPTFNSYCKKVSFDKDESIYNEIARLKVDLANSKPIAAVADEALGSLIAKKSPVVTSWIKRRKLDVNDPVNVAKQWRLYYIENIVLSSGTFKERPKVIQDLLDKELSKVFSELYTKNKVALLENTFKLAKKSALSVLKIQLGNSKALNEIENKVKAINIFIPKKVSGTKVAQAPRDFLEWGFSYDPKSNEINIGLEGLNFAYAKYRSTLVSLMAHEIAHSFDSCRYSGFYKSQNPFESIQKCLRNSTSAGAKYRDDSQLNFLVQNKVLTKEVGENILANPTCNRSLYPLPGKQRDQLDEIFADWFSAEVVAHSGIAIDNLRSELCLDKELRKGSSYVSNKRRLTSIYLTQPTIAKKLKIIENEYRHCSH